MYGYTYQFNNDKYQLYRIVNEDGHISSFVLSSYNQNLMDDLAKNFNAEIKPASKLRILYQVWFDNLIDLNRAIEYLNALDIMRQLTK
jgi:hypothetical protein